MSEIEYIVVWCTSKTGSINHRVGEDEEPVTYPGSVLDSPVVKTFDADEVFAILDKADGTMIAVPSTYVNDILGWYGSG